MIGILKVTIVFGNYGAMMDAEDQGWVTRGRMNEENFFVHEGERCGVFNAIRLEITVYHKDRSFIDEAGRTWKVGETAWLVNGAPIATAAIDAKGMVIQTTCGECGTLITLRLPPDVGRAVARGGSNVPCPKCGKWCPLLVPSDVEGGG